MKPRALQQGFTLIQISILLLVAGMVMVTILPSSQGSLSRNTATTARMNNILASLRQYEAANAALPCPADASQPINSTSYGVAAGGIGAINNCSGSSPAANYVDATNHVAIGMVPVRTLGLSNDYALDAFGRDITYAVDTNATSCFAGSLTGQITVSDNGTANNTIAALVSHGADGHGAWIPLPGATGTAVRLNAGSTDANQLINAHVNSSFSATTPLTNFVRMPPSMTFDDLLVYNSPLWTLNKAPAASSAAWPVMTAVPANGSYGSGTVLSFTVTFSSAVTVSTSGGTPYLSLSAITGSIGTGNVAKATYASGSGTASLTFSYTIAGADSAPTGLTILPNIYLNGGTFNFGGDPVCLTFAAPNLTGVLIIDYVYVADGNGSRVEIFNMSGTFINGIGAGYNGVAGAIGSTGNGNGQFDVAYGIAIDASGNIWVADGNNRLEKFNSSGTYITKFGSSGSTNGQFNTPVAIAVDASGNLWVTDQSNNRVEEFNSSGTYQRAIGAGYQGVGGTIGASGYINGQFHRPLGIAIDASGNVWVADDLNNRVQKFNSSGTWLQSVPSGCANSASPACPASASNGQFNRPQGIAFDASGNIWVTEMNNNRVQKLNSSGSYVGPKFGAYGYANGQFSNAAVSAIDASGNVWVVDSGNNRVEEFNGSGSFLQSIGGPSPYPNTCETAPSASPACASGTGNGQFNGPTGIATGR